MKTAKYESLDTAINEWLKTAKHSNIPINCNI